MIFRDNFSSFTMNLVWQIGQELDERVDCPEN